MLALYLGRELFSEFEWSGLQMNCKLVGMIDEGLERSEAPSGPTYLASS